MTSAQEPSSGRRLLLLGVLLAALGVSVVRATARIRVQGEIEATCALTAAGEDAAAVERSTPLLDRLSPGQAELLVACRCPSLDRLGRLAECRDLVAEVPSDAVTSRTAALEAIRVAIEANDHAEALRWAEVLADRFPPTGTSLAAELVARLRSGAARDVAKAMEPRLRAVPPAESQAARNALVQALARDGDVDGALAMLEPPDTADLEGWFRTRHQILSRASRQIEIVESFKRWESLGADPRRLQLEYALQLETQGLQDGARDPIQLYRDGLAAADPVRDADLIVNAYTRLVGIYMISGLPEEALATFREARARGFEPTGHSIEEIQRLTTVPADGTEGRLRFLVPGVMTGDRLLVAPADAEAADSAYTVVSLTGPEASLSRLPGDTPVRWVWTDASGRPLGSGASWPNAGQTVTVTLRDRPAAPPEVAAPFVPTLAPADGKPNLYVVVLDCGDWRLMRHLQARGELPTLRGLEALGAAGVLTSIPAMTGTAMEKLAHPTSESNFSFLSYVHHMGAELGGLASVGKNPLDAVGWLLKEHPYIFEVVANTNRVAANMLFSHGGKVDVGRNAEISGPGAKRTMLEGLTYTRPLTEAELRIVPAFRGEVDYIPDIAAEFDAGIALVQRRDIDLLLLRIEPLDLMTHGHYNEVARSAQDDGRSLLFDTYRYIDLRLAAFANALDADDTLVVMSDHGIQATMLHDPEAAFIAVGPRVKPGRLEGKPEIAGVARFLLDAMGVPVPADWPDTGISAAVLRAP